MTKYVIFNMNNNMFFVESESDGDVYCEKPEDARLFNTKSLAASFACNKLRNGTYTVNSYEMEQIECYHKTIKVYRNRGKWRGTCRDCNLHSGPKELAITVAEWFKNRKEVRCWKIL